MEARLMGCNRWLLLVTLYFLPWACDWGWRMLWAVAVFSGIFEFYKIFF